MTTIIACPCCGNVYFSQRGVELHPYIIKHKCFNCGVKVPVMRKPMLEAAYWWMEQLAAY